MVTAAGAGPRPVHHTALTKENFTVIIETLLHPSTKHAAGLIAAKMQCEHGVERAVEGFHANLPQDLACSLLPIERGVWTYDAKALKKQGKKKITRGLRLSPKAITVLSEHKMLDLTKLKL